MTTGLLRATCIAILLPLAGCAMLPDAYTGCNDEKPYQSAKEEAPLEVPAGADMPDTRNALAIPAVKTPALPPDAGSCLDHPPAFGSAGSAAVAGAAAPQAAESTAAVAPPPPANLPMDTGRPWQTRLGVNYLPTTDVDFDGGSQVEFNSSTGFLVGLGYAFSDHLEAGANFTYDERDYDATLAGDEAGETFGARGDIEAMGIMVDLTYYFMTGRLTPFITTGIGWNFVDTNIPTSPPQVGCWWNPWYGYVCEGFQDTKDVDGAGYQAGAGLRYRVSPSISLSGSYRMTWMDFPKADGTPGFESFQFVVNWGF